MHGKWNIQEQAMCYWSLCQNAKGIFLHLSYLKLIHLLTANSLYYNPQTTGKYQEAYRLSLYNF